jgi:hypothetical protein
MRKWREKKYWDTVWAYFSNTINKRENYLTREILVYVVLPSANHVVREYIASHMMHVLYLSTLLLESYRFQKGLEL